MIDHEYMLIESFYGSRRANRSGLLLMNHIDEGLAIMQRIGASGDAMAAFCLHPMIQNDVDFCVSLNKLAADNKISQKALILAMEYRRAANAYLCTVDTDGWDIATAKKFIGLLLPDVAIMLIADKMQNRKDFMVHHYGTHARSDQLLCYFNNWFEILDIPLPDSPAS